MSFFIPKSDKIILVGGWFGKRFADNSKFLYLYASKYKKELDIDKVVWITRSNKIKKELTEKNLNVYKAWSLKSIWYHFRAKYHFIDQSPNDINPFFSIRSKRINLWHGFPLKKIGIFKSDNKSKNKFKENRIVKHLNNLTVKGFWGDKYILATSDFAAKILGKAFEVPPRKILISGYPRNYPVIDNTEVSSALSHEKEFIEKIINEKKNGKYIFAYLPTFRDNKKTKIFGIENNSELNNFLEYLKKRNITVVGKFHFANNEKKLDLLNGSNNFINMPSDLDVYSFIKYCDVLITDYSSIYFDYLLWKKPIIFFPYDLEYYREEDRGFIFEYEKFTPGPKVKNINSFKRLLENGVDEFINNYSTEYESEAKHLKRRIFSNFEEMNIEHLFYNVKNNNSKSPPHL